MTIYHTGCAGFVKPRERYTARLDYVEFDLRAPTPSPKVLATWKKHRPENFTYGVVAPASLYGDASWPLRDPAKVRSELDRLCNNIDALGARVVVLRTPMAVSPGSVALGRLTPVLERLVKVAPVVVWEPSGLWEREAAVAYAQKLGVVVACDPLHDEVAEPIAYARMRGLGVDRRYHVGRLEALGFTGVAQGVGAEAMLDGEEADDEDGDDEDEDEGDEDGDFEDDDEEDEG